MGVLVAPSSLPDGWLSDDDMAAHDASGAATPPVVGLPQGWLSDDDMAKATTPPQFDREQKEASGFLDSLATPGDLLDLGIKGVDSLHNYIGNKLGLAPVDDSINAGGAMRSGINKLASALLGAEGKEPVAPDITQIAPDSGIYGSAWSWRSGSSDKRNG